MEGNTRFSIREEWLNHAAALLNEMIFGHKGPTNTIWNKDLKDLKISCGFPLGSRGSAKKLGQCLSSSTSESGLTEIYISPTLSDPVQVLSTLHHEMLHYMVGVDEGHGRVFRSGMNRTGLVGIPTATVPTSVSKMKYNEIISLIGDYPHSKVTIPERGSVGSNLIKVHCVSCGYIARTTQKWLDKAGAPHCPTHMTAMTIEI